MVDDNVLRGEMLEIRSELSGMREDLKRFMERSNQQHVDSLLSDYKSGFSEVFIGYAMGEAKDGLDGEMVQGCQMKEACKSLFCSLLKENISRMKEGAVKDVEIAQSRSRLKEMKEKAPKAECAKCFSEASRLLERQIDLMRSLRIYQDKDDSKADIASIPIDAVVIELLEPLANKQRLQIMKALFSETRTFSGLSAITGLRGGNLLFHLQKLADSRMILQRHERGDYMITEKGYKALKGIFEIYHILGSLDPSDLVLAGCETA
jgi:DNA-binding transcriptional ArsR family regulator